MGDLKDSRIIMAWSIEEKTYAVQKYFKYESLLRVKREISEHTLVVEMFQGRSNSFVGE